MADTKVSKVADGSNSEDEAKALYKDGETQPKKVDDSTPSGSGTTKTFKSGSDWQL